MNLKKSELPLAEPLVNASTRSPIFYGWWIVAVCLVMLAFTSGIGYYGLGVFLPVLEKEFQANSTLVSLGITIFFLVGGAAGPFIGRRVDLLGPKLVMTAGAILFGVGLLGLAISQALWQTYIAYAIMALGFNSMGLVTISALVSNWFQAKRGLAMSFTTCGLSVGGVIIVPLTTGLIGSVGWRTAAVILALLVCLISIPLILLVIRRKPEEIGLLPDGGITASLKSNQTRTQAAEINWTLAEARRTMAFWAVAIGYLLVYLAQTGTILHQLRFLTYGKESEGAISLQTASFAISMTALASITGRLALGSVIDRLNRRWVAVAVMLLQAGTTVGLLFARGNLALVYITVLGFGLGTGCVVMLHSLLISDLFGVNSFGQIYGATMVVTMFGTAGGPWLASFLFDSFGSYTTAFLLFGVIDVLAAGAVALARRPQLKGKRE